MKITSFLFLIMHPLIIICCIIAIQKMRNTFPERMRLKVSIIAFTSIVLGAVAASFLFLAYKYYQNGN